MDDDLAHQSQRDRLNAENQQENPEEQHRTVSNSLTGGHPLEEQKTGYRPTTECQRASNETKEPERLLSEMEQKDESQNVQESPQVHGRTVEPPSDVPIVLRCSYFLDSVTVPKGQNREEPEEITVQRELQQHFSAHGGDAACDIADLSPGQSTHEPVEQISLGSVDP